MNEIIEQYISDVRKGLYHLVPAEDYIEDLRATLEDHMQQFPDHSYKDLIERFGKPEDLASEYIKEQRTDSPKIQAKRKKKKRILLCIILAIIIILVILVVDLSGSRQSFATDTTIIYPEETLSE